jgi:hypothetical protein
MLQLTRIDQFAIFSAAQIDAVEPSILFCPADHRESIAVTTGRFDPHRASPRVIASVGALAHNALKAKIAGAVPDRRTVAFEMLAELHGSFDAAQHFREHTLAVEECRPTQIEGLLVEDIEDVIDQPVRPTLALQFFF